MLPSILGVDIQRLASCHSLIKEEQEREELYETPAARGLRNTRKNTEAGAFALLIKRRVLTRNTRNTRKKKEDLTTDNTDVTDERRANHLSDLSVHICVIRGKMTVLPAATKKSKR